MEIIDETHKLTELFPISHVKKLITSDIKHIDTLLKTLEIHHRNARSINILGTALKVIAGTPDFDDFENLKNNQIRLIDSNNRQIKINTKLQIQIAELTNSINTIITNTKKEQIDSVNFFEIITTRNRMVIIELQNLINSLTLAKLILSVRQS